MVDAVMSLTRILPEQPSRRIQPDRPDRSGALDGPAAARENEFRIDPSPMLDASPVGSREGPARNRRRPVPPRSVPLRRPDTDVESGAAAHDPPLVAT